MTEQELRTSITPCIMAGNTWFVFDQIKAYADARESKEIAELKADLEAAKKRVSEAYSDLGALAIKERLKADAEIGWRDSEIKRLREGISGIDGIMDDDNLSFSEVRHAVFTEVQKLLSPAPVTEDEFSIGAYAPECSPTFEQLTENDNLTMMQRLEKRMLPFHKIDSPKNEDHHE